MITAGNNTTASEHNNIEHQPGPEQPHTCEDTQRHINLTRMLLITSAIRGLVTHNMGRGRNWIIWWAHQGAMRQALDTWWLEVDPERKREMHQNEPETAQHEGPGMPPGGNNTTASEFQDIEHHPGPILEITGSDLQHLRTRSRSVTTP